MSTARFRKQGGYKQARNIGTSSMNADGGISTRSHISFHDLKDIPGATANMPPGTLIWKSLPLGNGRLEYKDNSNYWNILGTGAYDLWKPGTADYIYYDGGNVGIGIGNPAAKLHVIGNIHVNTDNYKNEIGYFTGASGATGNNSTAIGYQTKASGDYSTAMGQSTTASGAWSTAMGWDTLATGGSQSICCTAMGYGTIASWTSTAMGYKTIASGEYSTAMGQSTLASNWTSTAMGYHTIASGSASTAMGTDSTATGTRSTAMGLRTDAGGSGSTAMGTLSTASGDYSTAIGNGAYTGGDIQFAIGASGTISPHSADSAANMNVLSILKNGNVGIGTTGPAAKLHVIGNIHVNTDNYKNEIGYFTGASGATGNNSTAIGYNCKASGDYSTAMGYSTTASGEASTAMGYNTVAGASWGTKWSTAMGYHTIASGDSSTAMGWWSKASGTYSTAMGAFSLAEDEYCTAIGNKAYAGGDIQFAIGASGTAPGAGTTAGSNFNVLSILKNGNVGIGTTGPAAKLDISGNIHVNIDNYKNEIGYFTGASGATGNNSTAIGYQIKASGDYSTAIGYQTLATGAYSTAMGFRAVAGNFSTAMGYNCKASGNYSTAMGVDTKATSNSSTAMGRDTIASGISSTAMGAYSGATGDYCTAIGNKAYAGGDIQFAIGASGTAPGAGATAGSNFNVLSILKNGNVGIGTTGPTEKLDVDGDALINGITVGLGGSNISENTVVGYQALQVNTTGNKNVAVGHSALKKAETADRNTAVGFEALTSHTFGSENTAVGFQALTVSDGGTLNVAVGNQALNKLTVGEKNTAIGYWAGYEVTTGEGNTIIGYNAGNDITSGVYNTIIGYQAQGYDNDNNIIIGSGAQAVLAEGDNQIRLGNTDIGYAGIQVAWTVASDERIKSDIQNSNLGLNFINKLRPVSYYRNSDKSKKKEYGFIAQELDTVLNNAGASNNGIISKNDAGIYSVRYNDLIAPMVKAIQQQQEMINTLQQEIKSLNKNS